MMEQNCAGRSFDLRESGLGPCAAEVIMHVLEGVDQYTVINLGRLLPFAESGRRLSDRRRTRHGYCAVPRTPPRLP